MSYHVIVTGHPAVYGRRNRSKPNDSAAAEFGGGHPVMGTVVSTTKREVSGNRPCEAVIKAHKMRPKWPLLPKWTLEEDLVCVGCKFIPVGAMI